VLVIGAVLASGVDGAAYRSTFVEASRPAWWITTACGALVLGLGALTSGHWARGTAQRTAERLQAPETAPQEVGSRG
jgi:hypothetical protein